VPRSVPARPSGWLTGPTVLLVAAGLILGLVPGPLDRLLQPYAAQAGGAQPGALALWHGWTWPLAMTAIALAGGLAVYAAQRTVERRRRLAIPGRPAGVGYRALAAGVDVLAARVTAGTQRGSLPVSLGAILVVLVAFPGGVLAFSGLTPEKVDATAEPSQAVLTVLVAALAVAALRARRALAAVLTVSGVGYSVAVLFVLRGAPDLALTQILVETVTLIAAVLVIVRMPPDALATTNSGAPARAVRITLAVCVGALMTALALIVPGQRRAAPVSAGLAPQALQHGGGHNVVNVILVDVRGWDTFGEISVLVAAGVGVSSLFYRRGPEARAGDGGRGSGGRPALGGQPGGPAPAADPSPWLVTNAAPRRSLLLEVATRLVFHPIVMFSLYVLFVGHDQPGGGFAAGLIAGIALTLRYLAGGRHELAEAAPVDSGVVMGAGLVVAALTAAAGLVSGAALTSTIWQADLPVLGQLRFVSSTLFDIGVYLVVVGMVLEVLRSLGSELDRQAAAAARVREPAT
jgi:multicomponent Na+:H+ antiporter subunit A